MHEDRPKEDHLKFMQAAVDLAHRGLQNDDGGPFGSVVVKDGEIVGRGWNKVTSTNDPTAHAEVAAIRDACNHLKTFQLEGCIIYTTCEPCPMCLGAIYWARPEALYFACSKQDAAAAGFDDAHIYEELALPIEERGIATLQVGRDAALMLFAEWDRKEGKVEY